METEIIRIILDLSLIIIAIYVFVIKNYMIEKGKNLATKEDIKEITDKIESVKYEYLKKQNIDKLELELNQKLYNTLNALKDSFMEIGKLSQLKQNVEKGWTVFSKKTADLEILLRNHNSTYFEKYKPYGVLIEKKLNALTTAVNSMNQTQSLIIGNEVLKIIEEFKLEIYKTIKK